MFLVIVLLRYLFFANFSASKYSNENRIKLASNPYIQGYPARCLIKFSSFILNSLIHKWTYFRFSLGFPAVSKTCHFFCLLPSNNFFSTHKTFWRGLGVSDTFMFPFRDYTYRYYLRDDFLIKSFGILELFISICYQFLNFLYPPHYKY